MPSIRRMGEQFAQDRRITADEAKALVDKAKANGVVSRYEKLQLRNLVAQHRDLFDAQALETVRSVIGSLPAPPPQPNGATTNLDPSGAHRPVFLTASGAMSLTRDGAAPKDDVELGDAVYRMAELVDDASGNVFLEANVSPEARAGLFEHLKAALAKVPATGTAAPGLDAQQTLQLRASGGAVLLHLMEATEEPELRAQMLGTYETLVRSETNVRLRENLIFHLSNSAAAESSPVKEVSAALMADLAPTSPPYEKWFAGGNKVVNLEWTVGHDEFWKGFTDGIKRKGWKPITAENQHGVSVYEKTIDKPGVGETTFRISVREGGTNLLAAADQEGVHIIGYDGHSNWGRNMTSSIRNGPQSEDGADGKMFIYNLCVGKAVLDRLKETYPNMQAVATFGASYLDTDIDALAHGIAERADWSKLDGIFNKTDGFWDKQNFVTPISTLVRERVLDRDNDGQADYLDRHFNFDTFKVSEDTRREFQPIKQSRPASVLDGTKVNVAAQVLNTVSEFSSILERVNADSKVVANGWFEPKLGEREVVRFTEANGPDGKTEFRLQVNARYSHMSEEALRASVVYEFDRWLTQTGKLQMDPVDAKLNGLIGFAQSLDIDETYRDDEVWKAFLGRYNLPDIDRGVIQRILDAEHHHYAGSPQMVASLRRELPAAVLEALARPEVGEPVNVIG